MKCKVLISNACVLLSGILMAGCGSKSTVDFSGTWINEKMGMQKEVDTPDGWKLFRFASNTVPMMSGTSKLTSRWTDSEGNVWAKCVSIGASADLNQRSTVLQKYSKDGTIRESVWMISPSATNLVYPDKIDPKNPNYTIYYRAKE